MQLEKAEAGTIYIHLFGQFSIFVAGWDLGWVRLDLGRRSSRLWSMIAYLALHRESETPVERLSELFWPETAPGNPVRAVWLAISRCRAALEEVGIPDGRRLILSVSGGYQWNPNRHTEVDVEEFERLAKVQEGPEHLEQVLAALDLYRGDFWSQATGGTWASTRRIYYKSIYFRLCHQAVEELKKQHRWKEVAAISQQAVAEEPGEERFSVYFMQALTTLGQPEKALEHYQTICKVLREEYMVPHSKGLELARRAALEKKTGTRFPPEGVWEELRPRETQRSCSWNYPFFQQMVEMEIWAFRRTGRTAQVVLLELFPEQEQSSVAVDMKRMERTLLTNLRRGDPVIRISETQFLLLIPQATERQAERILARLEQSFHRENSHSRARIRYHRISVRELVEGTPE